MGSRRCEPDELAITTERDLVHSGTTSKFRMLGHMKRFSVHRQQDLRAYPPDDVTQFIHARMAGGVNEVGTIRDDLYALGDKAVDHPHDGLLVAGNGAGGEN